MFVEASLPAATGAKLPAACFFFFPFSPHFGGIALVPRPGRPSAPPLPGAFWLSRIPRGAPLWILDSCGVDGNWRRRRRGGDEASPFPSGAGLTSSVLITEAICRLGRRESRQALTEARRPRLTEGLCRGSRVPGWILFLY